MSSNPSNLTIGNTARVISTQPADLKARILQLQQQQKMLSRMLNQPHPIASINRYAVLPVDAQIAEPTQEFPPLANATVVRTGLTGAWATAGTPAGSMPPPSNGKAKLVSATKPSADNGKGKAVMQAGPSPSSAVRATKEILPSSAVRTVKETSSSSKVLAVVGERSRVETGCSAKSPISAGTSAATKPSQAKDTAAPEFKMPKAPSKKPAVAAVEPMVEPKVDNMGPEEWAKLADKLGKEYKKQIKTTKKEKAPIETAPGLYDTVNTQMMYKRYNDLPTKDRKKATRDERVQIEENYKDISEQLKFIQESTTRAIIEKLMESHSSLNNFLGNLANKLLITELNAKIRSLRKHACNIEKNQMKVVNGKLVWRKMVNDIRYFFYVFEIATVKDMVRFVPFFNVFRQIPVVNCIMWYTLLDAPIFGEEVKKIHTSLARRTEQAQKRAEEKRAEKRAGEQCDASEEKRKTKKQKRQSNSSSQEHSDEDTDVNDTAAKHVIDLSVSCEDMKNSLQDAELKKDEDEKTKQVVQEVLNGYVDSAFLHEGFNYDELERDLDNMAESMLYTERKAIASEICSRMLQFHKHLLAISQNVAVLKQNSSLEHLQSTFGLVASDFDVVTREDMVFAQSSHMRELLELMSSDDEIQEEPDASQADKALAQEEEIPDSQSESNSEDGGESGSEDSDDDDLSGVE